MGRRKRACHLRGQLASSWILLRNSGYRSTPATTTPVKACGYGRSAALEQPRLLPLATPHGEDAWSLFADRQAVELRMTARVRERLRETHGVTIPSGNHRDHGEGE